MTALIDSEFRAMNSAPRRFLQRTVEFPLFQRMGLAPRDLDIIEIGCGSGYGAELLSRHSPRSYIGVDLMPEQIALAQKRQLPRAEFMVRDATDLTCFPDSTREIAVIFGILHHIPAWRAVIGECHRILRPGGHLFLEEPGAVVMALARRLSPGAHPKEAHFDFGQLESHLEAVGFGIEARRRAFGFGFYAARKRTPAPVSSEEERT